MVPDNADLGVPQFAALQPDGTTTLQANDPRLSAKVYAVGGVLYGVHSTYFNNHIAVRWYRVRASDRVLLEQGTISDPNLDLYMPCIAANPYGVVMICFNGSGANDNISAYACAGQTVNGHTTFGNKILLQAGQDVYHDLNEVLAILLGDPPVLSRWGDYGSLSVDPADPSKFWAIQMFAEPSDPSFGSGVWATQVTQLITTAPNTAPPSLAIARSGTNVVVSWPSSAGNYQLYETTRLLRAVWTPVTQTTVTNGATISVTVPHTGAAVFFRLKK
jgi:hypothetical protein